MSNYHEYYPYNYYLNDQEINYEEMENYTYNNRYNKNKTNKYYTYTTLPQKTKKSRKEFEYNYIEAPNTSKTFRTYFRPICTCDLKKNYTRNKSYNSNKLSKSEYSARICPICGLEKGYFNQTQSINQWQNLSMNYMSTDINSQYGLNALDMLNKTISPNNNQLIYIMPKNKIHLLFRTCTCKKNRMALSQPKLIKNIINGNKVNQMSRIIQTEPAIDSKKLIKCLKLYKQSQFKI